MRSLGLPVLALVVVASWLLLPVVQADVPAQDAVPLHVAGDLVGEQPEAVYNEDARALVRPHAGVPGTDLPGL